MLCNFRTYSVAVVLAVLAGCGSSDDDDDALVCGPLVTPDVNEGGIGDFSNDPANPTEFALAPGVNSLVNGLMQGNPDYVAFTVDACDVLTGITLTDFTSNEVGNIAFVAIQSGPTFTVTPEEAPTSTSELDGFTHFSANEIGTDILALAGQEPDAIGFTTPLGPGTYTMWLNQTGAESEHTLVFNVERVLVP